MKIALIGATGFVGAHLLKEALLRNHEVTAILRNPEKLTEQHESLRVVKGDVRNAAELTALFSGHDVVISAYNAGWSNPDLYHDFLNGSAAIQQACKAAGIKRYLVVGGAGSLEIEPGKQLVDSPDFPMQWKSGALAARDYLSELTKEEKLDWVFLSPAIEMHPGTSGQRKGVYQIGSDQPVFDAAGHSRISVEDTAVALLDEAERPRFHRQRFTIAW